MIAHKLLKSLEESLFSLSVRREFLDIAGPVSTLSDEEQALICEHKATIISILNARQATPETPKDLTPVVTLPEVSSELPAVIETAPPEAMPPGLTHVACCPSCHGSNWGCVGSDEHGETWGCLTCHFADVPTLGEYCFDCKRRLGADLPAEPEPEAKPVYVGVTWGSDTGWIKITNPTTGETCEIMAKGLDKKDRWIFDRLERTPKRKSEGFTDDPDKIKDFIFDDYGFIGEVKMRETPIMSGKKWPGQSDKPPVYALPEMPPANKPATCPKCRSQRVKHLVADSMCMACGHRFETDYQPEEKPKD